MRLLAPVDVRACIHNFDNARLLGRGGFGEVYRGDAIAGHDGAVAVKTLKDTTTQDQRNSFMRELRIASSVDHPNVIQVLAACVEDPPCFVMPLMQGSLADWLGFQGGDPQKTASLPGPTPSTIKAAATDVFKGVKALHTATPPIVHLDLKPQNLLLDERGAVKVADVGLARTMEEGGATHLTTLHVGGTMRYWCPVYMRSRRRGPLTDVYSLGVVLLDMLVGDAEGELTTDDAGELLAPEELPLKYGWDPTDGVTAGWLQLAHECMSMLHNGGLSDKNRPTVAQALARLEGLITAGAPAATAAAETPRHERRCSICWDAQPNTAFVPCGHSVACEGCAHSLQTCPICRVAIERYDVGDFSQTFVQQHANVRRTAREEARARAPPAAAPQHDAHDAIADIRVARENQDVNAILAAMRNWPNHSNVQSEACTALWSLSVFHAENARRIGDAGGVELVLSAKHAHETNAGVQERACGALANLSVFHAENARRIGDAGGVALVLSAMHAHETNAGVQEQACSALWSLSVFHAANKSRIVDAGGVELVLSAMRAHETSAGVQEHACGALADLSSNHAANKTRIGDAGGVALVLSAMRAHETNAGVQHNACRALANLSYNHAENKSRIVEAGGLALVRAAMRAHETNAHVQEYARVALANLPANNAENAE